MSQDLSACILLLMTQQGSKPLPLLMVHQSLGFKPTYIHVGDSCFGLYGPGQGPAALIKLFNDGADAAITGMVGLALCGTSSSDKMCLP